MRRSNGALCRMTTFPNMLFIFILGLKSNILSSFWWKEASKIYITSYVRLLEAKILICTWFPPFKSQLLSLKRTTAVSQALSLQGISKTPWTETTIYLTATAIRNQESSMCLSFLRLSSIMPGKRITSGYRCSYNSLCLGRKTLSEDKMLKTLSFPACPECQMTARVRWRQRRILTTWSGARSWSEVSRTAWSARCAGTESTERWVRHETSRNNIPPFRSISATQATWCVPPAGAACSHVQSAGTLPVTDKLGSWFTVPNTLKLSPNWKG